jgi:uncharacterized protein (DUF362 family)
MPDRFDIAAIPRVSVNRRRFLKLLAAAGMLSSPLARRLLAALPESPMAQSADFDLFVVSGKDYPRLVREALSRLGFPGRFLKPGMKVVIKPNAAWSRTPEQAATTHPLIVAETVKVCLEAGVKNLAVVENPCDNHRSCFRVSGIQEAVEKAGARMIALAEEKDFVPVVLPGAKKLKKTAIARRILEADLLINLPIAKMHGSSRLTMAMKNHLGAVEDRFAFHKLDLHQCIADVCTRLKPQINLLDCTRILLSNGPKGPGQVKILDRIVAGTDQVAVDSFAAGYFDLKPSDLVYLVAAKEMGLGKTDLSAIRVKEISV